MKIAIVTGATGNLGLPIVKKFIDEDYKVAGTILPNDKVQVDLPVEKFEKVIVDLTNEEDSAKFVSDVVLRNGSVDVVVLTVGGFAMGSVAETKTSDIAKQYTLNFETAYNIAKPVFIQMLKQKSGRIFFVGSRPGLNAMQGNGMVAYGLAKSLIFRLAELMNEEAKGTNVVTSVIVPSTIDTPQNRKAMPGTDPEAWVKPETIAEVIYFYCTDAASALREPVIKVYNNS
jgi:NAD(P)-dependent dehydrogenase (short-subunit alcohol dehydrogenase family)